METRTSFLFPPFRLDLNSEQLWHDEQAIALRPKTFAVLRYLIEHPGQLVTKDELLDAVWVGTVVSDTVLKSCIRELRLALADDVQTPQFIATVHRRGYRWVAADAAPVPGSRFHVPGLPATNTQPHRGTLNVERGTYLVGRDFELAQLHGWLDKALQGERQLVFVTGEAGIGKTTLVDTVLQTLDASLWLGRGQCIEQYGAGEAYMPILEALGRLCREPGGEYLIALLNHYAPTWLVQMPTLLNATELETLQRKVQGVTRERMLREMVEAIDAITAEQPLVLWLEDLHWSDPSTLELLALLARRRETARLLILGTYRPVDVIVSEHPLRTVKQELQLHGQCTELAMRLLSEEAVEEYLGVRFSAEVGAQHAAPLQRLAHMIHQRTEGNPLFMVNVVDELLMQGKVDSTTVEISTPAMIRQLIEQHLERLSAEDHHLLEAASVAGMEFSVAAVAGGVEAAVDGVEARCAALERRGQFLQARGTAEWPDGTITTRYGFLHALYQEVTYKRIPVGRRVLLHQRIGERTEAAYGKQATEIAAELAVHFERGRDYQRAVQYLQHAGKNALRRSANQEAVAHLTKGLELLKTLPDTPERNEQELELQVALGGAQILTKGYSAAEVELAYGRARELCQQVKETPQLFWTLWGLWGFYEVRGNSRTSLELAKQLLTLAQGQQDPLLLIEAYHALGENLSILGELVSARTYLEQGIALYDPQQRSSLGSGPVSHQAAVVSCLRWAALALWPLGYPDQAFERISEALSLAQELSDPFNLALVLDFAANVHQYRREAQTVQENAEAAIALSHEHGFPQLLSHGMVLRGWAMAQQGQTEGGIAQIRQGIGDHRASGAELGRTYWLTLLVETLREGGQGEEALNMLDEALAAIRKKGKDLRDAELYRLKGELTLQQWKEENQKAKGKGQRAKTPNAQAEAEECFLKAIDIARRQSAKSWELRASTSLARLWQQQGKRKEAHKMLAEIYGWFTEGFDTKDLQEAKALLGELSH
jgi:DNA-binding winged helix-turn-helix (wHTH) protein/predicted ATPase